MPPLIVFLNFFLTDFLGTNEPPLIIIPTGDEPKPYEDEDEGGGQEEPDQAEAGARAASGRPQNEADEGEGAETIS